MKKLFTKLILFACVGGFISLHAYADSEPTTFETGPLPVVVDGIRMDQLLVSLKLGIYAGEDATMYLARMSPNGTHRLLRISEPGVVSQFIRYNGYPFILGKDGRLLGLEPEPNRPKGPSDWTTFLNNIRASWLPIVSAGAAVWLVANMYSSAVVMRPGTSFSPVELGLEAATLFAVICGVMRGYFMNRAPTADGGNYFVKTIAVNVTSLKPSEDGKDFVIETKFKPGRLQRAIKQVRNLSDYISNERFTPQACGDALVQMYAPLLRQK